MLLFVFVALVTARDQESSNLTAGELTPPAASNSGGGCFAHLMQTGSFRLTILNPILSTALKLDSPFSAATSSGGSSFHLRYLVFVLSPTSYAWSYPCYLLYASYAAVCTFHASFGDLANCCLAEYYSVVVAAVFMMYEDLVAAYGGPLGAASTYMLSYFPYIKSLPLRAEAEARLTVFGDQYCGYTQVNGRSIQSQWVLAFVLSNPPVASRGLAPYNYGYDALIPRYANAFVPHSAVRFIYYENLTLTFTVTGSSNLQGFFLLLPSAISSKQWDVTGAANSELKLFGLTLSYVTVKKLLHEHQIVSLHSSPHCSSGCPMVDGAAVDSFPVIQSISYAVYSKIKTSIAPFVFPVVGPASSLGLMKVLAGMGPLEVYSGNGVNLCPFDNVETCITMSRGFALMSSSLVSEEEKTFLSLKHSYEIWLPDVQIFSPVCSDPIQIDLLSADCLAANYCDLLVAVLPSIKGQIPFTADTFYAVIAILSLASTSLSEHFVHTFLPAELLKIPYYEHLDRWFPNYSFFAKGKGGFGFSKESGNSLMDYITYLTQRVGASFTSADGTQFQAPAPSSIQCKHSKFLKTMANNVPLTDFHRSLTRNTR